ncbi:MAG: hypothetical protein AABX82_08410, partial [Nanoarchaeota archaeon]
SVSIPEVNEYTVGMLIALFERTVGLYATLVNINAYHQPGVEAGKKAAAAVLTLQQEVTKFLSTGKSACTVQEITSSSASCYWIGSPQGPRYNDLEAYQQYKETIKAGAENGGCTFIDSEEYTSFAFCDDDSFGCDADPHFDNHGAEGKTAAQEWALGVYADFLALVED